MPVGVMPNTNWSGRKGFVAYCADCSWKGPHQDKRTDANADLKRHKAGARHKRGGRGFLF